MTRHCIASCECNSGFYLIALSWLLVELDIVNGLILFLYRRQLKIYITTIISFTCNIMQCKGFM